ncbi:MAG: hypothetical protein EOO77_16540 [Oxalobacteraceae bacterium]|nr:MAG: hypothetical protein EOO77_16540 [Oxalobacteraceae bacterium]
MDCALKVIGQLVYGRKDWLPTIATDVNEWQKLGRRSSRWNARIWVWLEAVGQGALRPLAVIPIDPLR